MIGAGRALRALVAALALAAGQGAIASERVDAEGAIFAVRTIPAGALLSPSDIGQSAKAVAGALTNAAEAVGLEARVALYAGRAILRTDLRPPALVDRNQMVVMRFARGPLAIRGEGRALDRGAVGERIRVMNIQSRNIVSGVVLESGEVEMGVLR